MLKKLVYFCLLLSVFIMISSCSPDEIEAIEDSVHEHTFSTKWQKDNKYHWHPVSCEHDLISDKSEHIFNEDGICIICGYYTVLEGDWIVDENGFIYPASKEKITGSIIIPDSVAGKTGGDCLFQL